MVATKNHEVLETVLKFAQQRLSPPSIEQIAAVSLFDVEQNYFTEVNAEYKKRRDVIFEGLNAIDGVKCHMPKGAFYCMVQLPVEDAEHFCKWMLSDFRWENSTVMMAPGNGFYATAGKGKNEVRIAYVLNTDDLKKACTCLKEGLTKYKQLF
jgi:aspartate aminotransferase